MVTLILIHIVVIPFFTEVNVCASKPCLHGECIELNDNQYRCDCSNTLHTGDRCEIGIIEFDIPILRKRAIPYPIQIFAKPDKDTKLSMEMEVLGRTLKIKNMYYFSQPLGVLPPYIKPPFSHEVTNRILLLFANEAGRYKLQFNISQTPASGEGRSVYPKTLKYPVVVVAAAYGESLQAQIIRDSEGKLFKR